MLSNAELHFLTSSNCGFSLRGSNPHRPAKNAVTLPRILQVIAIRFHRSRFFCLILYTVAPSM